MLQSLPGAAVSNRLASRELIARALSGKILSVAPTRSPRSSSPSSPPAIRSLVVALLVAPPLVAHAQCSPSIQKLITDTKYDEARAEVESLIKKNGSDDAALHCMGRVHEARGESGKAVD